MACINVLAPQAAHVGLVPMGLKTLVAITTSSRRQVAQGPAE